MDNSSGNSNTGHIDLSSSEGLLQLVEGKAYNNNGQVDNKVVVASACTPDSTASIFPSPELLQLETFDHVNDEKVDATAAPDTSIFPSPELLQLQAFDGKVEAASPDTLLSSSGLLTQENPSNEFAEGSLDALLRADPYATPKYIVADATHFAMMASYLTPDVLKVLPPPFDYSAAFVRALATPEPETEGETETDEAESEGEPESPTTPLLSARPNDLFLRTAIASLPMSVDCSPQTLQSLQSKRSNSNNSICSNTPPASPRREVRFDTTPQIKELDDDRITGPPADPYEEPMDRALWRSRQDYRNSWLFREHTDAKRAAFNAYLHAAYPDPLCIDPNDDEHPDFEDLIKDGATARVFRIARWEEAYPKSKDSDDGDSKSIEVDDDDDALLYLLSGDIVAGRKHGRSTDEDIDSDSDSDCGSDDDYEGPRKHSRVAM
ncbi:hypothetical protein BGX23_008446 [Mortierella sp. AD031]|nr:hypothetical protein BGX23_008446 [Mortierella sp. AD031]